jgi:holo-[acyl-carrier protein] synthase
VILGVGIDLVAVDRMARAIDRGSERLLERLFTPAERLDAEGGASRFERLAVRFAAKEAAFKALGTGWSQGIAWRDVEVVKEVSGRACLRITGRAGEIARGQGVTRTHLSLSHHGGMAAAVVVLEGEEGGAP